MAASKTTSMLVAVMMIAGLFQSVSAVTHTVTWTFGTSATQFDDWANQQKFQVGDVIAFIYDAAAHNVFEVSKADLETCTLTNPIVKYEKSNATVTLSKSGYYGFICGFAGHCSPGNMKMNVEVLASTSPVSAPGDVPAPPPSDASSLQSRSAMVVGALVAGCAAVLL